MLIIGVGNPFRGDDGIGPFVIATLMQQKCDGVTLVDGGTDAMQLIEEIKDHLGPVIIIDAVDMKREPGTIEVFKPGDAKINLAGDAMSTHGFGLAEMLKLLETLEIKADITICGMQPADISFQEGFSEPVEAKIEELIETIRREFICSAKQPS